jgi:Lrp/AsnC family transcriptional regulator
MLVLDRTDVALLRALQDDATVPTGTLAEQVGLSQSPCWRRIRRLEQEGAIVRRTAVLDRARLGFDVEVFVRVRLSERGLKATELFEQQVLECPEILECHMLLGEIDYRLRIVVQSLAEYEVFLREKLSRLPGVRDIESSIVISTVKNTTALPLDLLHAANRAG